LWHLRQAPPQGGEIRTGKKFARRNLGRGDIITRLLNAFEKMGIKFADDGTTSVDREYHLNVPQPSHCPRKRPRAVQLNVVVKQIQRFEQIQQIPICRFVRFKPHGAHLAPQLPAAA
jgi:hypothetical protein